MENHSLNSDDLRRRVAGACRVLGELDITPSTYGHVSARLPGSNRIFIRARGPAESGVRYTREDEILEIDFDGRIVGAAPPGYASPLEVHIHTELYRRRPDVHSVVHVHPSAAVLLTICNKPLLPIYGSYDPPSLALALAGIPIFERSILIRKPDLGAALAEVIGSKQVCLMRGHGITTAANSIEEAALLAIHLNTLATMTYQASLLGDPQPISAEDQDEFRALQAAADAQLGASSPGQPSSRSLGLWRYYARLTEERAYAGTR